MLVLLVLSDIIFFLQSWVTLIHGIRRAGPNIENLYCRKYAFYPLLRGEVGWEYERAPELTLATQYYTILVPPID